MQEWRFWSRGRYPELCPIVFYMPLGLLVVMPRLDVLTDEEFLRVNIDDLTNRDEYQIPVENKANSFGWYRGRPVAIDYGN